MNEIDLSQYDRVVVAFSGGKDSLACLLTLLERGVPKEKIELWHHDIDGREGSKLMDWAVTRDYCRKLAAAFGVKIYFSWLEGGFEREMNRNNTPKAATVWENPDGSLGRSGGQGKGNTRLKFPQVSADLSVRWCSAYLKIDVGCAALAGQERFFSGKTLFVTGERAEESKARANYKQFEPHRSDNRNGRRPRYIDHWRPVHQMTIHEVWALIKKYRVNPHPSYRVGIARCSCQFCIFASACQLATARVVSPDRFAVVAGYEVKFGKTIHRNENIVDRANKGTPAAASQADIDAARSETFNEPIFLAEGEWKMPLGAFAESCGPS